MLPVVTDVSDRAAVEALRDAALSAFGAVHVVCNNAGVGGPHGPLWECPPGEWDWVLAGEPGGRHERRPYFMPVLLEQDAGHLLNTSSIFGVFAGTLGPYGVSKHAVTALTGDAALQPESLGVTHVGVSVLCPSAVRTNFGTSSRNRPASAGPAAIRDEAEQASAERFDQLSLLGASPAEVAGMVVDGIRSRRFYILTSDNRHEPVLRRGQEIVAGGRPSAGVLRLTEHPQRCRFSCGAGLIRSRFLRSGPHRTDIGVGDRPRGTASVAGGRPSRGVLRLRSHPAY